MKFSDMIKGMVAKPKPTVTVEVLTTPEAAAKLLADPPKELAGIKVLSVAAVEEDEPKQRKRRRRSKADCDHRWVPGRSIVVVRDGEAVRDRVEKCSECADQFPCRGRCYHLDCIERAYELGLIKGFPRDYPMGIVSVALAKKHTRDKDDCPACAFDPDGHYDYYIEAGDPPEKWITMIPLEPA